MGLGWERGADVPRGVADAEATRKATARERTDFIVVD